MADKDEYVSVLERGNMASPDYRAYLERKQALEGSYPELALGGIGSLLRQGGNFLKGMLPSSTKSPQVFYELQNAQRTAAINNMSKKEFEHFYATGELPVDFAERMYNASAIGSKVRTPPPSLEEIKALPQTHAGALQQAQESVLKDAMRRLGTDTGINTANMIQDYNKQQRQPTQADVVQMLRGYAYGGMIPNHGNRKDIF